MTFGSPYLLLTLLVLPAAFLLIHQRELADGRAGSQ